MWGVPHPDVEFGGEFRLARVVFDLIDAVSWQLTEINLTQRLAPGRAGRRYGHVPGQ